MEGVFWGFFPYLLVCKILVLLVFCVHDRFGLINSILIMPMLRKKKKEKKKRRDLVRYLEVRPFKSNRWGEKSCCCFCCVHTMNDTALP